MSSKELDKRYDPKEVEERWYKFWIEKGLFHADGQSPAPPYSIVIPPPNITGSLHMGHALDNTLQDILIRWRRMQGFNALWMPGTDHAGIATQNVVERKIMAEKSSREAYGRERFVKRVWDWRMESGREIIGQLKRLGSSCDWERERFTMDEGFYIAVKEAFVRLYEDGLIYRGNRLINWCPRCSTALSDLEVEHEEIQGRLYYIRYPLSSGMGSVTIATTRPETMLGDSAVAVNPEDERYGNLIGKSITLPIVRREIPIISDRYVDPEFGTGALKITPAHDPYDFEIGLRHNLPQIKVVDESGVMNEEAGGYAGKDRFDCRREILEDLKNGGYLQKIEDHRHSVGHCYRCRTVIEPIISLQWFIRMQPLAEPAIAAVEDGRIKLIPGGWAKTYFEWMRNIKDWCISRQIWWGHQIPAWHCNDCRGITVSRDIPETCVSCNSLHIYQDGDVLDTWFSSSLWPFAALGWPNETRELKIFYPTSSLVTGFDILFFWVARMIMMGLRFTGDVPFREVYLHALIRDQEGQKMSKSKGNVIDPIVLMERFGTDALRFSLASQASPGRDIKLSPERVEGMRNFTNKIWNAARFILMNLKGAEDEVRQDVPPSPRSLPDRWILSLLQNTIKVVTESLEDYRFDLASQALYQFVWHEFCDWHIEFIKDTLQKEDEEREDTISVLLYTFDSVLRLLHPFMPFITEEVRRSIPHEGESVMVSAFPKAKGALTDPEAEDQVSIIKDIILGIRNLRGEMNIPPSTILTTHFSVKDDALLSIEKGRGYIERLARTSIEKIGKDITRPEGSASCILKGIDIFIPLSGIIDPKEEIKRQEKGLLKIDEDLKLVLKRLADEDFRRKAPKEVVEKEETRKVDLLSKMEKIEASIRRFRELL
ncbi:MAG: valine--tRNA ligase [Nitrospirae bacterium]|nr:valine--tRNA ligase [Nitrospirota bacterium]